MKSPYFFLLTLGAMIALLAPRPLFGDILIVDAKDGAAPYHAIQAALDKAQAGDTVRVKPGLYRERVEFKSGGTQGHPVTLEGEPGAIIDGSDDIALDWQPAPDIGPGVYRLKVPWEVYTTTVNGQILTTLQERRVNPDKPQTIHNGWKNLDWHEVFGGAGVGPTGWDGVRALAMYRKQPGELIVRFKDELDPRTLPMTVSQNLPCVTIRGHDRCVVRGLMLRYASHGVVVEKSLGDVVENCVIGPVDYGVELNEGADRCTVRYNDISYQPYADSSYNSPGQWDNWQACKTGGFQDRWAVRMYMSAGGHRIHDNYIHDEWDGVDAASNVYLPGQPPKSAGGPDINPNVEVDHNYFYRVFDDAIETYSSLANGRYHENIFNHCRCAFRIKAPTLGPIFSYRNVFLDNGEDFRNWGEYSTVVPIDPNALTAEVWVYQNTCTSPPAVNMNYTVDGPKELVTAVNYHYFNNLFWCEKWVGKNKLLPNPDWKGDGNVFVQASASAPYPWSRPLDPPRVVDLAQVWDEGVALAKASGIDLHSLFVNDKPPGFVDVSHGDVSLTADSVARGQGLDLSTVTSMGGLPLPGCPKGYFAGKQPDAGALQFGQPMFHVPRKPEEAQDAAAGTWP